MPGGYKIYELLVKSTTEITEIFTESVNSDKLEKDYKI